MTEPELTAALITTRKRAAFVAVVTALQFTGSIRRALSISRVSPAWRMFDLWLSGRALMLANIAYFALLLFVCFSVIRCTHGRERILFAGWFTPIVLIPFRYFLPQYSVAFSAAPAVGEAIALVAALSLLLTPASGAESSRTDVERT